MGPLVPAAAQEAAPVEPAAEASGSEARQWESEIDELMKLVSLLPPSVRTALEGHAQLFEMLEVVMDLGRPPIARFPSGDVRLSESPVSAEDLDYAVQQVGSFGGDNRAGEPT